MFGQHRLICFVHTQMHCVHQPLVWVHLRRCLPTFCPVYQPSESKWCASPWTSSLVFSLTIYNSTSYKVWSIIFPVQAFLMALSCFDWSVSVYISVWGYSGCPTGYCLTFFPSTLNFTCFAISDGVNQCDRSTLSLKWKILHCQCRIFLFPSWTKGKWLPTAANRPHKTLSIEESRTQRMTSRRFLQLNEHKILQVNGKCHSYISLMHILVHTVHCYMMLEQRLTVWKLQIDPEADVIWNCEH